MAIKITVKRRSSDASAPALAESRYVGELFSIGSGPDASLSLSGPGVAREQAVIFEAGDRTVLRSTAEGNEFNAKPLPPQSERPLAGGDLLCIGDYLISFTRADGDGLEARGYDPDYAPPATREYDAANPSSRSRLREFVASMQTEEYRYYFRIAGGRNDGARIFLETAKKITLGWAADSQAITTEPTPMGRRATVEYKLTSEFVIEALIPGLVSVNSEMLDQPCPLKDGDRIHLAAMPETEPGNIAALIFHVPVHTDIFTIVKDKKEDEEKNEEEDDGESIDKLIQTPPVVVPEPVAPKIFLGYFTLLHLLGFFSLTLLVATLTFLLLEYW